MADPKKNPVAAAFNVPVDQIGGVLKKLNVEEEKKLIREVHDFTNRSIIKKISLGDYLFCVAIPIACIGWSLYVDNSLAAIYSCLTLLFGLTVSIAGVALRDYKARYELNLHQRNTAMEMFDALAAIKQDQIKMAVETLLKRGDISLYVAEADDDKVTKH
ncbi:MAG: hypothetical protein GTO63_15470 [Anaerolineae bacterium]|nr:hypothetical protein [Anaerolineae bacterium]NIN96226.1 hypothetical protein [Anaerolineae bacterium]NIQ79247.1 hypothetical protein [Anaerolineae bacterium]